MRSRTIAGWMMSPQLWEAWNFRAEANPPAPTSQTSATPSGTQTVDQTTASQSATPGAETVNSPEALLAAHNAQKDKLKSTTAELASTKAALQKLQDAQLSDLEKAQKEAADLKATLAQRDHADLQREVAAEQGLPAAMANRLQGATREELTADAKTLVKLIPPPAQSSGNPMNPATGRGGSSLTMADIQKMTPAQYQARRAEVLKVLAGG